VGLLWTLAVWAQPAVSEEGLLHPAKPGLLICEEARDSTRDFTWIILPGTGRRSLVWEQGAITVPEGLSPEEFGVADIAIPYSQQLTGVSAGRRLLFESGRYVIKQPLLMIDGANYYFFSAGEILLEEGRIVYRREDRREDPRASYLLLAAMVILVAVLLFRARSILSKR
jgi:hypothetical protein